MRCGLAREVVNPPGNGAAADRARNPIRVPQSASAPRKTSLRELEIRKRRRGIPGYDDLLTRLAEALGG